MNKYYDINWAMLASRNWQVVDFKEQLLPCQGSTLALTPLDVLLSTFHLLKTKTLRLGSYRPAASFSARVGQLWAVAK